MSKKPDDPEITVDKKDEEAGSEGEEAKAPEKSAAERKLELFTAADEALAEEKKAEAVLEEAKAKRSAAVKQIKDELGGGKWRWRGKVVRVGRKGDNYHFVEVPEPDIEEIGGEEIGG